MVGLGVEHVEDGGALRYPRAAASGLFMYDGEGGRESMTELEAWSSRCGDGMM